MKKILVLLFTLFSMSAWADNDYKAFEIGPSARLLYVPQPLSLGLEARLFHGLIGLSAHRGFLPEVDYDDYNVRLDNIDFGLKIHPGRGPFYMGVLFGDQTIRVTKSETVNGQNVDYKAKLDSNYWTPHIGWIWKRNSGFFYGVQLGWQFNTGADTDVSTSQDNNPLVTISDEYQDDRDDVEDAVSDLGNKGIPNVGLVHLGWYF